LQKLVELQLARHAQTLRVFEKNSVLSVLFPCRSVAKSFSVFSVTEVLKKSSILFSTTCSKFFENPEKPHGRLESTKALAKGT